MSKEKSEPAAASSAAFHPALVRQLVTQHIQEQVADATNDTTSLPTLTPEAADVIGELLKIFVEEARNRASMQAEVELLGDDTIQVRSDHCTKISAEMLMDFS